MPTITINTINPLIPVKTEDSDYVDYAIFLTEDLISSGFFFNYHNEIQVLEDILYIYPNSSELTEQGHAGMWLIFINFGDRYELDLLSSEQFKERFTEAGKYVPSKRYSDQPTFVEHKQDASNNVVWDVLFFDAVLDATAYGFSGVLDCTYSAPYIDGWGSVHWDGILDGLLNGVKYLFDMLGTVLGWIGSLFNHLFEWLGDLNIDFGSIFNGIGDALGAIFSGLGDLFD